MSRNLNCGPRFNTGLYHYAPTSPPTMYQDRGATLSIPSSSCRSDADAQKKVRALWPIEEDTEEINGSEFSSSACSSSAYEDKSELGDGHEFGDPKPNSFGVGTYITSHEKALAAREAFLKNLMFDVYKLNPRASEFVPQLVQPPIPHPTAPLPQLPLWFPTFVKGAQGSLEAQDAVANELIGTFPWNLDHILHLAQHFCWMGALDEGTPYLAAFATTVNKTLKGRAGEEVALEFMRHLQQCCFWTFMAFWDMAYPNAITFQTTDVSHIRSAISLTSFMGDLFNRGLLFAQPTMSCLQALVRHTVSLEHLVALRSFLLHAGKTLWFTHPSECAGKGLPVEAGRMVIAAFREDLRRQTMKMTDTSRVLGKPNHGECREIIEEILAILKVWML